MSDGPDGAPIQPAEVHDQIRRNVPNIAINLFRSENQRLEWLAFVVGQRLDSRLHFALKRLALSLRNHSLRLAPLNIEENASVVSAFAPDFCFAPVHVQLFKWRERRWIFVQHQQPFANQPFVDRYSTVEPLRTVI